MKLIVAIIRPSVVDAVVDALAQAGASGLTVSEVRGYGRQKGKTEIYRGVEYEVRLIPKVRLEIAVSDELAPALMAAISETANSGRIGDGKIFVLDLESALRIRTGERDEHAIGE
jgi:nitrogen regulatory protein P-II 2